MKRSVKIWLIVAASCMLVGGIMFAGAMFAVKGDFTKLSTVKYENKKYEIDDSFEDISINTKAADIVFLPSDDDKCTIICDESEKIKYSVSVKDDKLTIAVNDMRKWYDHIQISISFDLPKITVYMPADEYGSLLIKDTTGDIEISKDFKFESADISLTTGDVKNYASVLNDFKIKSTTGDIGLENISVGSLSVSVGSGKIVASHIGSSGNLKLEVGTGDIELTDVECKSLSSNGTTGDVSLKNVIAKEKTDISRGTGNIRLELFDSGEIFVKTTTGSVKGTLLSDKIFDVETTTGKKNIPSSAQGGKCKISTGTGDVDISIKK